MATHTHTTAERRPEATPSATGRRSLMATAPLLALALAAPAGAADADPSADAELIATCAAFDNLERAYIATDHGAEHDSPEDVAAKTEQDRLTTAQDALVNRMVELRAITREGMAARARSLILWDAELMKADGEMAAYTGGRLTQALVRDLLAGSAAA